MSAEAVRLVEQIQDALGTEDVVAALADPATDQTVRRVLGELAEPDFQVVMNGPAYLQATFEGEGFEGFRAAWLEWTSAFQSYRIEVERVIDAGDLVVSLVAMTGRTRTGGVEIESPGAAVWTVVEGRLRRVEFHLDREQALRAAGIDPERP
jgi:ketosteroid isomerase-like protein